MRKIALMFMFIVVFVFSVVSVEGQLRSEAVVAGYHSVLYTGSIQSADVSLNYVNVLPQSFNIGWGVAGRYLSIVGDSGGNYTFNSLAGGSRILFVDPVNVNGILTVGSNVNAVRFCDVNGLNCFTGSLVSGLYVNVSNLQSLTSGMYSNISSLQAFRTGVYANVSSLQAFRTGVYANVSSLQSFTSSLDLLPATCASNGQVLTWNGVDWVCQNAPGGSIPSCVAGQILVWNSVSSSWGCYTPSMSPSLTCAVVGQVLTWNGASWVCQTPSSGTVLPVCSANQYLMWNGVNWVCGVSLGLPNPWITSGSNIYYTGGNVGIGTSTPSFALDVSGNVRSTGSLSASSMNTPGTLTAGSIVSGPVVADSVAVVSQKICYASSTSDFIGAVAIPVAPSWSSADCRTYSILLFSNAGYHSLGCTTNSGSPKATVTEFRSNLASIPASEITGNCGWTAEPVTMLINNVHNTGDCLAAGGSLFSVTGGLICRFNSANCGTGWNQYLAWSTTSSKFCSTYVDASCSWMSGAAESCTTGGHAWNNLNIEECIGYTVSDFGAGGCIAEPFNCWATRTQVGCY